MNSEEQEKAIPAFSMWQLLVDTMPGLLRIEGEPNGIKQLASIITSKEHTNIFVYNKHPKLSYAQYIVISNKYKSFTVWLLGRLFYMLSLEKLNRIHSVIIEAQLSILEQVSSVLLHFYREFTEQYSNILQSLTNFVKNGSNDKCILNVFIPELCDEMKNEIDLSPIVTEINGMQHCESMLIKVLKFFYYILEVDFVSHHFNFYTFRNLDDVLYLLCKGPLSIKFEVMRIYLKITDKYYFLNGDNHPKIDEKLYEIANAFEQITYDVYNSKIKLKGPQKGEFESILSNFMELHLKLSSNYSEYDVTKLAHFYIDKSYLIQKTAVQKSCIKILENSLTIYNKGQNLGEAYKSYNYLIVASFRKEVLKEILEYFNNANNKNTSRFIKVFKPEVSKIWSNLYTHFIENRNSGCTALNCVISNCLEFYRNICTFAGEILLEIRTITTSLEFFKEADLFYEIINKILRHQETCNNNELRPQMYMQIFVNYAILTAHCNLDIIFNIIAFPLLLLKCGDVSQLPNNFIGVTDVYSYKKLIMNFYQFLNGRKDVSKVEALKNVRDFFKILSSGLVQDLNDNHLGEIEKIYGQIYKPLLKDFDATLLSIIMETIPCALTIFPNADKILTDLIVPAFSIRALSKSVTEILPTIICIASSSFIKTIQWNGSDYNLTVTIYCNDCNSLDNNNNSTTVKFNQLKIDLQSHTNVILKHVLKFATAGDENEKIVALKVLPFLANHFQNFHFPNITKIWMEVAQDLNRNVRNEFSNVVYLTVKYGQENLKLSTEIKQEILEIVLEVLLRITKKSLTYSDYDLQETTLCIIEELSRLTSVKVLLLPLINMLLYFIIFATSKHSLVAVSRFFDVASKHNTNATKLYTQYKRELSETIVHLCAANQEAINYNLGQSLKKLSLMLGFQKLNDFVLQAGSYLLPHFVSKTIKMPAVKLLIKEMAYLMDVEVSEMLSSNYGTIFVHVFLNEAPNDCKACLRYVEENCEQTAGSTLRKQNFRVISNELLINFHDKKAQVILALELLAKEDAQNKTTNIPDYLQSQFLGVLQYFDAKLIDVNSKKDKVLQSLADLLRFMSSRHLVPLRFKIIAMLQTTDYENYPKLICAVWEAFVRTCPVEVLGPQLATIFISILPLMQYCPSEVNNIFKYLVVENEPLLKEYVTDLFFIVENGGEQIHQTVLTSIRAHLKKIENFTLREKIKLFLKYATHETMEVKICGLKYLKGLLEKAREDLDQMILGYNGIDPSIVELIDIVTLGCREKYSNLKLICGELIGELGAVEPSHLPRRYSSQETGSSFAFFINDDPFIVATLNELTKALQAVKNTQKMDRYSLAIQEILKFYEISPEESKNKLWKQLTECQQELMKPLLSSRYTIIQSVRNSFPCPVYGSPNVISFHSWLSIWTSSLIADLPSERAALLQQCFPSMQNDHRILMHFLPLILLHSLIEGTDDPEGKASYEINTVISSVLNPKKVASAVLHTKPISIPGITPDPSATTSEEVQQIQCTKVVFLLLDFLDRWVREWQCAKGLSGRSNSNYQTITSFLDRFCKLELAKCNYRCGEYPRALMYLEDYVTANLNDIASHLSFLAEIYAQLEEPDGVAGVTALRQAEPTIEERILALEVSGKLSDAAACYERIPPPLKLHHIQGLVHCYLDLDNVNTALNFAQGAVDLQPEFGNMLLEMQAEPLWRLGRYDELKSLLTKPELDDNKSWGVQIGKALINFKDGNHDEFSNILTALRMQQVDSLGSASLEVGAYQHGYSYISRLHALNELEQVEKCVKEIMLKPNDSNSINRIINKLSKEWDLRIKVVHESVRIIEPLLCLRRVAIEQAKQIVKAKAPRAVSVFNSLLGELWLLSTKTARAASVHQQAYTYTLKAEEYAPPKLFVEKAKLHWLREEHQQALTTLERGVACIIPHGLNGSQAIIAALSLEERKLCAEARLLIASYNDSTSNVDTETNVLHYREAVDVYKEWEKSLVCLGQYYDRIFQQFGEDDRDSKGSDIQIHMINYFGKSLLYGTNYVYQSMPRILSIWFDYGTRLLEVQSSTIKEERKTNLCKMSKLIDSFLERLPSFIFLTAFSQLVSRICHPQREVYIELKSIIIKLLIQYPQQTLWMIISVVKSGYAVRAKRCSEILGDARLKTSTMTKLVKDFTMLAEKLIELCNKQIADDVTTITVSTLLRQLPRMLSKSDFSEIMVPTHKFRKLILPNPDFKSSQHNPFPNQYVHIAGIEEEVVVLQSLQRPRKITLKGSDGQKYIQMLKPKDDLRKDFRLMEFNDIVNQLLSREPEARQRRLNIRLYSVSPLNEECGLIEWVPNLLGLRPVLMSLYKQKGVGMKGKELKENCCNIRDSLEKKREIFTKKLLPRHPPVLSDWFRKNFPDAQNWLTSRTAYIRTTAVISMVGFVLGLGDRHGENILLDSMCGDTVHVDFNCLFNKGETFEWPERVPFRLTQNMVSAMGPLGVEGVFRKSCACTLRVLRTNATTLMSIVKPFVYDPLVSWPRNVPATHAQNAERTNDQAVEHVKNIELRLQGIIKTKGRSYSIPLSVDGQTNVLINEAMSVDNLCQMYIGWGPYL